jgi:hypothetical protein
MYTVPSTMSWLIFIIASSADVESCCIGARISYIFPPDYAGILDSMAMSVAHTINGNRDGIHTIGSNVA